MGLLENNYYLLILNDTVFNPIRGAGLSPPLSPLRTFALLLKKSTDRPYPKIAVLREFNTLSPFSLQGDESEASDSGPQQSALVGNRCMK